MLIERVPPGPCPTCGAEPRHSALARLSANQDLHPLTPPDRDRVDLTGASASCPSPTIPTSRAASMSAGVSRASRNSGLTGANDRLTGANDRIEGRAEQLTACLPSNVQGLRPGARWSAPARDGSIDLNPSSPDRSRSRVVSRMCHCGAGYAGTVVTATLKALKKNRKKGYASPQGRITAGVDGNRFGQRAGVSGVPP